MRPVRRYASWLLLASWIALLAASCQRAPAPAAVPPVSAPSATPVASVAERDAPPPAGVPTRREPIEELLFGVRVADPYRWLEAGDAPDVLRWIEAQNARTEAVLGAVPERAELARRLEQLLRIGELSRPDITKTARGLERLFYAKREGGQNQPVLYVRDAAGGAARVVFDPNRLAPDGSTSLDWFYPSPDGSLVAYGTSQHGSEESTLRLRRVDTGEDLDDVITRTRAASVCFRPDGRSFFYTRYPKPGSVPAGEEAYHRKLYEHVIGRDPETDRLVFGATLGTTDYPHCELSPNGRWLVVEVHQGWNKSELYLADTTRPALDFVRITPGGEHVYNAVVRDHALFVRTDEGAARYALYRVDPARPERANWRLVLPEHPEDVLADFDHGRGRLFVIYSRAGISRLERFDEPGRSLGRLALPVVGKLGGVSAHPDGRHAYFDFQSFAVAPTVYQLEAGTGKAEIWAKVESPIDPNAFTITAGQARSKDGTQVPYLIVSRAGTNLQSGDNPTVLYGYGGFNVSLEPRFSPANYALLERGVVLVQANLRGGGEFGESWHRAGQLEQKQNVFDDFIAVAEALQTSGVTSRERLAVQGRSNGGLLVAAVITQRPELFRAAVSSVPLTDMLRYHRFLIARLWIPEYGSPEDATAFQFLRAYSPYHQVRQGVRYPAVLLTTAASDTRVDPLHARKFAAALQHATSSGLPVLLRSEDLAGHGAGKPITKQVQEYADVHAFLLWQLGVGERASGPATEAQR